MQAEEEGERREGRGETAHLISSIRHVECLRFAGSFKYAANCRKGKTNENCQAQDSVVQRGDRKRGSAGEGTVEEEG